MLQILNPGHSSCDNHNQSLHVGCYTSKKEHPCTLNHAQNDTLPSPSSSMPQLIKISLNLLPSPGSSLMQLLKSDLLTVLETSNPCGHQDPPKKSILWSPHLHSITPLLNPSQKPLTHHYLVELPKQPDTQGRNHYQRIHIPIDKMIFKFCMPSLSTTSSVATDPLVAPSVP